MTTRRKTPEFVVAQLAGSCRLEGIRVSRSEEKRMLSIVAGKVDGKALSRQLAEKYRAKHLRTLPLA